MIWEMIEVGYFGPPHLAIATKLASAFGALKVYCNRNKQKLDLRMFTMATLGSPSATRCPELHVKAHDSKVIVGERWASCSVSQ